MKLTEVFRYVTIRHMKDQKLTEKQRLFVVEYLIDLSASEAAIRAGYSKSTGPKLLANPLVSLAIKQETEDRSRRTRITADTVLQELMKIARVDVGELFKPDGTLRPIHEIPETVRRAISSFEYDKKNGVGRVRLADKMKALELLGKHLGIYTEKIEVTNDSLAERLAKTRKRMEKDGYKFPNRIDHSEN